MSVHALKSLACSRFSLAGRQRDPPDEASSSSAGGDTRWPCDGRRDVGIGEGHTPSVKAASGPYTPSHCRAQSITTRGRRPTSTSTCDAMASTECCPAAAASGDVALLLTKSCGPASSTSMSSRAAFCTRIMRSRWTHSIVGSRSRTKSPASGPSQWIRDALRAATSRPGRPEAAGRDAAVRGCWAACTARAVELSSSSSSTHVALCAADDALEIDGNHGPCTGPALGDVLAGASLPNPRGPSDGDACGRRGRCEIVPLASVRTCTAGGDSSGVTAAQSSGLGGTVDTPDAARSASACMRCSCCCFARLMLDACTAALARTTVLTSPGFSYSGARTGYTSCAKT
mmetsp:Transcript_9152/g.35803  ORF Transcript_9152/g.35803 Transcript_9152/m.35803 type:complete len:344 (+) Transcript_9152:434-1465(+)